MKIRWLESGKYEAVTGVEPISGEPIIETIRVAAGEETEVRDVQNNDNFHTSMIICRSGLILYGVPQSTFLVI
jgi:hypothetical protein